MHSMYIQYAVAQLAIKLPLTINVDGIKSWRVRYVVYAVPLHCDDVIHRLG